MKNDHSFKIAAAVILAGLITAFVSPGQSSTAKPAPVASTAPAATTRADVTE